MNKWELDNDTTETPRPHFPLSPRPSRARYDDWIDWDAASEEKQQCPSGPKRRLGGENEQQTLNVKGGSDSLCPSSLMK